MPDKHPNTERWGGPGASHEDRSKPQPPQQTGPSDPYQSQVSGGGGEQDDKHVHDPKTKSDKTPAS